MRQGAKRKIHIDFIRIVAIYLVLFNHTGTKGYMLFTIRQGSFFYPIYIFNAILIKIAVPLFFMVSGALVLKKEESYPEIIRRFFKFSFILIVASIISYLYRSFRLGESPFSVKEFLVMIYTQPIGVALWYLYAYLAFLLMYPILHCVAVNMDKHGFLWIILMYGFISSLTIIEFVISRGKYTHYAGFSFFIQNNTFFYPIMGYYIENKMEKSDFSIRRFILLTIASIVSISTCSALTHWKCTITGEWNESNCQTFFNTLIFIPSFTVYYGFKMFFEKHPPSEKHCELISSIGGATFGLYLIENICRKETMFVYGFLSKRIPSLLACWIWIAFAFTVGIAFTLLLKRIKIVSKFI